MEVREVMEKSWNFICTGKVMEKSWNFEKLCHGHGKLVKAKRKLVKTKLQI